MTRQVKMTLAGLAVLIAASAQGAETGTIAGTIVDSNDQGLRTGRAAVFVCDAATGRPFKKGTFEILGTEGVEIQGLADMAHAVTDDHGHFELTNIPLGKYRLVAQSWLGFAGVPDKEDPSEVIYLHGVANDVELKAGEKPIVFIRPLGTATMTLINDPEEEHAFLVLSTAPMRGDPVLPFPFWGENFATHAIGITLMETHKVTFHGLPAAQLHAGLFNYDNNPGVGGVTFQAVDGGSARIPIYATWSNGKYDPSESLLPLVEHLEQTGVTAKDLLKARYPEEYAQVVENRNPDFFVLLKHGDEMVSVEGFGEVRLLDLAAADSYRQLRAHHKSRQQQTPAETKASQE